MSSTTLPTTDYTNDINKSEVFYPILILLISLIAFILLFVFKKDYNKLKNNFENNISNISLKYLFLQQQIQVNKIYDYIDELLEIQNGNEKFGDIQYLILLCYKYNN